jgi:hypothetical protein
VLLKVRKNMWNQAVSENGNVDLKCAGVYYNSLHRLPAGRSGFKKE